MTTQHEDRMSPLTQQLHEAAVNHRLAELASSLSKQGKKPQIYQELLALTETSDEPLRHAAEECLESFDAIEKKRQVAFLVGFSVGTVGQGDTQIQTWQYLTFLRRLKSPHPVPKFQRDLTGRDKVFRLYGLLGLSETNAKQFWQALPDFQKDSSPLTEWQGDFGMPCLVRDVAAKIERGSYRKILRADIKRIPGKMPS